MSGKDKKVSFESHLRVLGNIAFYFGVVRFKFDLLSNAFNCTKFNTIVSFLLLGGMTLWYGFLSIGEFVVFLATALLFESTLGQKFEVDLICTFFLYLPSFLYVSRYFVSRRFILPIVAELFRIFNAIKDKTTPSLYYKGSFNKCLYLKLVCVVFLVAKKLWVFLFVNTSVIKAVQVYAQIVCSTLDMGYVYSQLVLVCVYDKMSEILRTRGRRMDKVTLTRCIKRFSRISARIHRVKRLCDDVFMPLFGAAFAGLLWDLIEINDIEKSELSFLKILSPYKLMNVENVLNIFLVHCLARMLIDAHAAFHQTIGRLVLEEGNLEDDQLEADIEVMVLGDFIYGLTTWAYGVMRVNAEFLWNFFLKVVVVEAIVRFRQTKIPDVGLPSEELQSSDEYFL